MPVDKDLKNAHKALYDDHDALGALKLCDGILKEYPGNLMATIYKASSLEKLYYGSSDWHNDQTLENAKELLKDALTVAQERGDRSKVGLVYFRHFIHYFNAKQYVKAEEFMKKCKEFDYKDDTLPLWEVQLTKKLQKLAKKDAKKKADEPAANLLEEPKTLAEAEKAEPQQEVESLKEQKFRTDWYQTQSGVVISLFPAHLPSSADDMRVEVADNQKKLEVAYKIAETQSEFQYSVRLLHEVVPQEVQAKVFTKKVEITLKKAQPKQWKTLESLNSPELSNISSFPTTAEASASLDYPSSSKKHVDWSKIDVDDDEDDSGSADAFFQKLYANADPDTKRAMMKSFIESNGTALNTNWEDVSKKKVETSPPEGMEVKSWQ